MGGDGAPPQSHDGGVDIGTGNSDAQRSVATILEEREWGCELVAEGVEEIFRGVVSIGGVSGKRLRERVHE
jgi:hypothetical protein